MGGETIGNHVAVGAGAVVTKDLPSRGVYAGVPAKKLRIFRMIILWIDL